MLDTGFAENFSLFVPICIDKGIDKGIDKPIQNLALKCPPMSGKSVGHPIPSRHESNRERVS